MAETDNSKSRKPKIVIGGILVAAIVIFFGVPYYLHATSHVSTDDAFVEGHVIPISPKVAGHVADVFVKDNQEIEAGAPLVEIDPKDYEVKVDWAKAEVAAADAQAKQAREDAKRYETLAENDEISRQQLDKARMAAETADAQSQKARADLETARLNLSYAKIDSPATGRVTRKSVEAGSYVQVGQPLMAVVPPDRWIIANFKETQLTHMRPGQEVSVKIDTYPGKRFKAHVESIQRGTGARFSLLPPENATGNFVKVVQRVPVKIVFDETPDADHPLLIGMSVEPEVKIK